MNITTISANRVAITVPLQPVGATFFPTNFPDVGAALYRDPKTGKDNLVVESFQSMANRLEAVIWDPLTNRVVEELVGMPYVAILDQNNNFRASSITLPHRIGTGYARGKDAKLNGKPFVNLLLDEIKQKGLAAAVFKYCPNSLVHGFWLSQFDDGGLSRMPRILSAAIDAYNVVPVVDGGAVHDPISNSGKLDLSEFEGSGGKKITKNTKASELGLGNVLHYHESFAAERIEATFSIDLKLLQSTGLPQECQDFILYLSYFKIYRFLMEGLRLRSACDLEIAGDPVTEGEVPEYEAVCDRLASLLQQCRSHFAQPPVTQLQVTLKQATRDDQGEEKA